MSLLIVVAVLLVVGVVALIFWMSRDSQLRRLVPAAVGSAAGVVIAVVFYLFVFQVGQTCTGRGDFGCQINANQGLLTLLGLVLAFGAIWTTILTRFFDQKASDQALQIRVNDAVVAAMEEARHNLIHVALVYDDERDLCAWPLIKIDRTLQLLQEPVRHEISEGLVTGAEKIQIQFTALERLIADEKGTEMDVGAEPFCVESLVVQFLGILIWGGKSTQVGHDFLHGPGLQDLHVAAMSDEMPEVYLRTSDEELTEEAPTLRSEGTAVVCWWNDAPLERLEIFEEGPRFSDLAEGHAH